MRTSHCTTAIAPFTSSQNTFIKQNNNLSLREKPRAKKSNGKFFITTGKCSVGEWRWGAKADWMHVRDTHSPKEHAIAVPTIPPPDIITSKSSFSEVLEPSSRSEDANPLMLRTACAPLSALSAAHCRPIPNTASLAFAKVNMLAKKQTWYN